jgi:hypothetical protein
MSAETMSPGPSVATAPAVNATSVSSFSGEMSVGSPSLGGTHMPGFDSLAFQDTFEMPSPSLDSFAGGKSIPDVSAFENMRMLWQAPLSPEIPEGGKAVAGVSAFENTQTLWQTPEINNDTQTPDIPESQDNQIFKNVVVSEVSLPQTQTEIVADFKSEPVLNMQEVISINLTEEEAITKPKIITEEFAMPDEMVRQNVITRVREAIKYEEVMMRTREPEKEINKLAVKTEEKTAMKTEQTVEKEEVKEEKDNNINHRQTKLYFEHDTNADETRKTVGLNAIEKVNEKIADEKIVEARGQDIAEQMPNPQPKEVKSEIAKDKDGSYESLIRQLETAGTIYSTSEAKSLIEKSVNENHAVKISSVLSSQEATENEVKKVLGDQNTLALKI